MGNKYTDAILEFLADRVAGSLKPRQLARQMGIPDEEYGAFRRAYKILRDSGRLILGSKSALTLPAPATTVIGRFQRNPRGFGFVVPEEPSSRGDLFVPPDRTQDAMTGDLVVARVRSRGGRRGRRAWSGEIVEIRERGMTLIVGTLEQADGAWFVIPDGRTAAPPIIIGQETEPQRKAGTKVVVEIAEHDDRGDLPSGTIVETLGPKGVPAVELLSIMRSRGIDDRFPARVVEEADRASNGFRADTNEHREDMTALAVVTIDPDTARDHDDAVSVERGDDGTFTLGVHIADVSHFVPPGSVLDEEARRRGTSVYFPGQVVPMLPEALSNDVCSLREGARRYAKSVFIKYDSAGRVLEREAAATVIRSLKQLTYSEAQQIADGTSAGIPSEVVRLVRDMYRLARLIETRRVSAGMLSLDLPEIELVLDDEGRVVDGAPADTSYSHKVIEMFMVEANETIAGGFTALGIPLLRRIHPAPNAEALGQLATFLQACGHNIPRHPKRRDFQRLLERVRGRPEAYAVNLALLRSLERASYSYDLERHYALAGEHYCHFTSPIRRYPDLLVHRELTRYLTGRTGGRTKLDWQQLSDEADALTTAERNAAAAENEAKLVLVLQHLERLVDEEFAGIVTGVADFGIFVQWPRYGVEGLVRLPDLGDDWWEVSPGTGQVHGQVTGKSLRIGDLLQVRIKGVNVARRHLDLVAVDLPITGSTQPRSPRRRPRAGARPKSARQRPRASTRRE